MRALRVVAIMMACLLWARVAAAVPIPPAQNPLVDQLGLLDSDTRAAVVEACTSVERDTSAEIAVLIMATTGGEDHQAYGVRVFNAWGIGKSGVNNGVLLLFAMDDRRVEIIPGHGYRGMFSKAASSSLLKRVVVPRMRAGDKPQAVLAAVNEVARIIRRNPDGQVSPEPSPSELPPVAGDEGSSFVTDWITRGNVLWIGWLTLWGFGVLGLLLFIFSSGKMVVSRHFVFLAIALGPVIGVGLAVTLIGDPSWRLDELTGLVGGGAGIAHIFILAGMYRRICPKCNKRLGITSRTITAATTYSSGTGSRTYHCPHCQYHRTESYTIPRVSESSSSSSSAPELAAQA